MGFADDLKSKFAARPGLRRWAAFLLLLLVGAFDYLTGPDLAVAPFYILVLLGVGFFEAWPVCLAYSGLAALIYLVADLAWDPTRSILIYPYWRAFARLFSFSLISSIVSQLVRERRQLRESEQALQATGYELAQKNRMLEEHLERMRRLQEDLVAKERQAAVADTIYSATYEMERPLVSISIYAEEALRKANRDEGTYPLLDKIAERVKDMEGVLKQIRRMRRGEAG